ncbi:MAG: tRNA threonylcarbamoyladenosine dehydratase [Ruminiclostridium sp.]|nr:tRNA threonylcarbamoyladenosine dehydratase [Ruminiclostridium sp.]
MDERFSRAELMFGSEAMEKLKNARVAVSGIGGVGGYTAEALARGGIGALDLIDNDDVSVSNINRQIYALDSTVGKLKVEAAKARIHDICPDTVVNAHACFFMPETAHEFDFSVYDYVVDAIDTVTGKLEIIKRAKAAGVPVITAMGAGNKLDPTMFRVSDISKTKVCPLARVMRYELKKLGISGVKAVYSEEEPIKPAENPDDPQSEFRRSIPASNSFVPPVAGLIMAGEVIKDIAGINKGD